MKKYIRITNKKATSENTKPCYDNNGNIVMDKELFELLIEEHNQLWELENQIENGTLIELPCKVGDTVWYINSYGFGRYQVEDMEVVGFNFSRYEDTIWVVGRYGEQVSHVYKTKEQAEKKLRELQGE